MSLEEIAASALAGMEGSLPSSPSSSTPNNSGAAAVVVEGDNHTNVVPVSNTTTATNTTTVSTTDADATNETMQESAASNTKKDQSLVKTSEVTVDDTTNPSNSIAVTTSTPALAPQVKDSTESLPQSGDITTRSETKVEPGSLSTTHPTKANDAVGPIEPEVSESSISKTELPAAAPNTTGVSQSASSTAIDKNTTNGSTTLAGVKTNEEATTSTGNKPKRRGPKPKVKLPIEPRLIQCIPKRKEYTNHTYSDFSMIPLDPNYVKPSKIDDMSFVEKIHDILSKPEYNSYIGWKPNGRTFGIIIPSMFEKVVCPIYFQHKRYSSFLRQLNNHGFKHLTNEHGPNRNCYYHECFLRNMEYLCQYMPEPKDARRQIPDPMNEPNFDAISLMYPVPPPHLQQHQLSPNMIQPTQLQQQMMAMQHPPHQPIPIMQHIPSALRSTIPTRQPMVMNTAIAQTRPQISAIGPTGMSNLIPDVTEQQQQPNHQTTGVKKMTMDRNAALAELSKLQDQLTSEAAVPSLPDTSITSIAPTLRNDKRTILSDDISMSDALLPGKKMKLGVAMPQAFPNTTNKNKLSQVESKLKRDAIMAAMRKQREKEEQQEQQKSQQSSQSSSFSLYPNTSLQGLQQQEQQQQHSPHLIAQPQHQPQQQYQMNTVSDYVANPTTMHDKYNNRLNRTKQSLYSQQVSTQQNPFQSEIQFNSQTMGQHQQQRIHSQHLQSGNVAGFPQSQQQQIQELRNQLLQNNNNGQPTPQHLLPFIGTSTASSSMNRNDTNIINDNDDNTHLRGGTTSHFM